jgi:hypothetical protein
MHMRTKRPKINVQEVQKYQQGYHNILKRGCEVPILKKTDRMLKCEIITRKYIQVRFLVRYTF